MSVAKMLLIVEEEDFEMESLRRRSRYLVGIYPVFIDFDSSIRDVRLSEAMASVSNQ